jgi:hypothetical protein
MLLSERNPETYRHSRTRALPISGPIRSAATLVQARRDREDGGRVFPVRGKTQCAKVALAPPKAGIDPLYLFVCGLSWRKCSDTSAGWELIRCLQSSGQAARIAAAFLAQAEQIQPPVPGRVGAIDGPEKPSPQNQVEFQRSARRWL